MHAAQPPPCPLRGSDNQEEEEDRLRGAWWPRGRLGRRLLQSWARQETGHVSKHAGSACACLWVRVCVSWGEWLLRGWFAGAEKNWLRGSHGAWALHTVQMVESKFHTEVPQETTIASQSPVERAASPALPPEGGKHTVPSGSPAK